MLWREWLPRLCRFATCDKMTVCRHLTAMRHCSKFILFFGWRTVALEPGVWLGWGNCAFHGGSVHDSESHLRHRQLCVGMSFMAKRGVVRNDEVTFSPLQTETERKTLDGHVRMGVIHTTRTWLPKKLRLVLEPTLCLYCTSPSFLTNSWCISSEISRVSSLLVQRSCFVP